MATEHEMKLLDIDAEAIKKKVLSVGGTHILDREMKRKTYDIPPVSEHRWMRLRDDGEQVTLSVKEIEHAGVDGTNEWEVMVSGFDEMSALLEKLGFRHKHYQENRRSSYSLDGVDVEVDSWPGIPPYLELEGPSEDSIRGVADNLGISQEQLTTMNTLEIYDHYGLDIREVPVLTFTSFPASR